MKIQMFLIPQQLKTYSQVLTIAQEVERGLEKKNQDKMQKRLAKEARLEKPIILDQFSKSFYERFFPITAQKEMEEQFIRLQ